MSIRVRISPAFGESLLCLHNPFLVNILYELYRWRGREGQWGHPTLQVRILHNVEFPGYSLSCSSLGHNCTFTFLWVITWWKLVFPPWGVCSISGGTEQALNKCLLKEWMNKERGRGKERRKKGREGESKRPWKDLLPTLCAILAKTFFLSGLNFLLWPMKELSID